MKSGSLLAVGALMVAGTLGVACGSDEMEDSGTGGASGGNGTGGGATGGSGTGGNGTGGSGIGGSGTGGAASGGQSSGGAESGGSGGSLGGMAGDNMGGLAGMGGMGGAAPCSGCIELFVPLTGENMGTSFDKVFAGATDLSGDTVTARVHIVTAGVAGFIQVYAGNGADQNYASAYSATVNLTDAASGFIDVSLDVDGVTPTAPEFDSEQVVWIGINVQAGDPWTGATWGDTAVYVDSITFENGGFPDMTFDADAEGMRVNPYTSPLEGSTLTHLP